MNFQTLLKVLYALGIGAAAVGVQALQSYFSTQSVDFSSLEGIVTAAVVAAVARGLGWLLSKLPKEQ